MFSGCSSHYSGTSGNNGDLGNLRIGVYLGHSLDDILTDAGYKHIYRFNSMENMLLALVKQKIDVIGVNYVEYCQINAFTRGLRKIENSTLRVEGYLTQFAPDEADLRDEFNEFLAEYKQTEEYQEYIDKIMDFDGVHYEGGDVELTGTGRVIHLACVAELFPLLFSTEDYNDYRGFDINLVREFCNARNYRLKVYNIAEQDRVSGLYGHKYDMSIGGYSDRYIPEIERAGLLYSDCYEYLPLYLIERSETEKVEILHDID